MWKNFPLFPERASALAWQVDGLYFLLIAVSAFFTLLIFVLIFVFAVKYRRSVHPHPVQIEGSLPLELAWTLIPLGICMIFFAWGSLIYFQEARPPKGAMEVYAVGKQWMWKFEYESGQRDINQLHVPVGRDVKMMMSSQDVIHSFFVPAFRVKADVLPGRFTEHLVPPDQSGHLSPGKPVLLEDGRTVIADENYIRESILLPGAKIVSGFSHRPTFQGQVSEEGLMALVAYVKSLSQSQPKGSGERTAARF